MDHPQLRMLPACTPCLDQNESVKAPPPLQLAYHNDVLVGAIACRLEKSAPVGLQAAQIGRPG